jgi:cytochrome c
MNPAGVWRPQAPEKSPFSCWFWWFRHQNQHEKEYLTGDSLCRKELIMRTHIPRITPAMLAMLVWSAVLVLAACGGAAAQAGGDPAKGEQIFKTSDCIACHTTTDQKLVGPGLKGIMDGKGTYGDKLPNGKPRNDQNAAEWIKIGGVGKIGQMPGHTDMTQEQLLDLVAFLKTLK